MIILRYVTILFSAISVLVLYCLVHICNLIAVIVTILMEIIDGLFDFVEFAYSDQMAALNNAWYGFGFGREEDDGEE